MPEDTAAQTSERFDESRPIPTHTAEANGAAVVVTDPSPTGPVEVSDPVPAVAPETSIATDDAAGPAEVLPPLQPVAEVVDLPDASVTIEAEAAQAVAGTTDVDEPSSPEATAEQPETEAPRPLVEPLPAPPETRVMVVANQKGGVGKTTTTVNLAAALAMGGLSVVVVDLDPQGNASTALGVEHGAGVRGTYEVLLDGDPIEELVVESREAPNLRVLPATVDLAAAEVELVSVVAREGRLNKALRTYLKDHPADYVFFDCPPSLGLLTLNALVAANEILIPIQCEYYALEGVSQLMQTINLVKGELNDDLELSTVLLTMFDARTKLAAQVVDEVRAHFAEQTLPMVIPRSVRISEAPSYGQTVLTYQPESTGAESYLAAAKEIARRGAEEKS